MSSFEEGPNNKKKLTFFKPKTTQDEVFAILTAPDNHEVFSSIVAIPYRKVLRSNDFLATRQVAVDHDGRWRLGPFRGKVRTKLLVDEDARARTVRFALRDEAEKKKEEKGKAKGSKGSLSGGTSFMSKFEGGWRVAPLSQSALDAALKVRHSFVLAFFKFVLRRSGVFLDRLRGDA